MTLHEEILEIERLHNPNFIMIGQSEINEAIKDGLITEVARSKSKNGNIYYLINRSYVENTILMHVKNEKYIVINNRISGGINSINLMDILPKYSFYCKRFGKMSRERVVTSISKNRNIGIRDIAIERLITSYNYFGELVKIKKSFHVHHKAQTYDNREFTTMLVHKSIHKDTKNHKTGYYVDSHESFVGLLKQLKDNNEYYRTVNWVE